MSDVFIGVEDDLSYSVAKVMVKKIFGREVNTKRLHARAAGGSGQIRLNLEKYFKLAELQPVIILTDLDQVNCAPSLIKDWMNDRILPKMLSFRIAVKEIESWLLADQENFSKFLGVRKNAIPSLADAIVDPKATLLSLALKAKGDQRQEIVKKSSNGAKRALGYNEALSLFVETHWDMQSASMVSESLKRACYDLVRLKRISKESTDARN